MMKDVNHIPNSSWVFLDFCSKKYARHSINLKCNLWEEGNSKRVSQVSSLVLLPNKVTNIHCMDRKFEEKLF